jgi:biopolymer transport protein ExbD
MRDMTGLTQPLQLKRFIHCAPRSGFDVVPFLDAVLITLFVALNASSFVTAPGVLIDLPSSQVRQGVAPPATAVLTVDRNHLYFLAGAKIPPALLASRLEEFIASQGPAEAGAQATLLIKADASIASSELFQLMALAQQTGFSHVHLAAESARDGPAGVKVGDMPSLLP